MKIITLLALAVAVALPAVMLAQEKGSPAVPKPPDTKTDSPEQAGNAPAEVVPVTLPWKCTPVVPKPSKEFERMAEFFKRNLNIKDISRILAPADMPFPGFALGKLPKSITEYGGKEGTTGAIVTEVLPDSSGARAGLRKGDIVIALDGVSPQSAAPEESAPGFAAMLRKLRIGQTVTVSLLRDGGPKEISLTVGKRETVSLGVPSHTEMSFDEVQEFSVLEKTLRDNAIFDRFLNTASQISGAASLVRNKTRVAGEDLPNAFQLKEVTYCLRYPLNTILLSQQISDRLRLYASRSNQNLPSLVRECAALLDIRTRDSERFRENAFMPSTMLDSFSAAASELDAAFNKIGGQGRNRLLELMGELLPSMRDGEFPRDSEKKVAEMFTLAAQVNYEKLVGAALAVIDKLSPYNLGCMAARLGQYPPVKTCADIDGDVLFYKETSFGTVIVGGKGPNVYRKPAAILIDLGGDDVYLDGAAVAASGHPLSVLIDFAGDDAYLCKTAGPCSAVCGIAVLLDFSGNDIYSGSRTCEGWASAGVAVLADFGGQDIYRAESLCQGGALFGIGILLDTEPPAEKQDTGDKPGSDTYIARHMSQGTGLTRGFGALIDCAGGDTYRALSSQGTSDKAGSPRGGFSQGCGLGMKPADGGIGILVDCEGDDYYVSYRFSQGASRLCGLGILCDAEGDDVYLAGENSQGAGRNMSAASLIDWQGNDRYSCSRDGSQGFGFDWSVGYLFDGGGDDSYTSRNLAQGAGSQVSIGMLVDTSGSDSYNARGSAQGFGKASGPRNAASLGILFDREGTNAHIVEKGATTERVRTEYGVLIDR